MQGPQENNDRVVLGGQEDMLGGLGLERVQRMETPSSGPGVRVDQEGHPHPQPWGEHGRCSPGIMVGAWPRGAKGSACPDSCCSFVTCPGSAKRRKVVLGVMAEGPLCPCVPVPPKTGIPSSTHPSGHRPCCHRNRLTSAGETPLYWPCMEKPWGEKKGASVGSQVGTIVSGHSPLGQRDYPEPTRVSPCWQRLPPGHLMPLEMLWPLT